MRAPAMRTTILGFSLVWVALAVPALAQAPSDPRWEPWLGCWDLVTEGVPRATGGSGEPLGPSRGPEGSARPRVCVAQADNGVRLRTLVGSEPALEQTIVADGTHRPLADPPCTGTEVAEWSIDGRRLFSQAELTCPGQPARRVSGLALFGPDGGWIDVQAVTVGEGEQVRVRHFRRVEDNVAAARLSVPTRLTVAEVTEASRKVSAGALEAALLESRARFDLSGRTLLALDADGVPGGVVDLMVALSYPQAFAVERARSDDRLAYFDSYPYGGGWDLSTPFAPWGWSAFDGPYFLSPYYYSPFAFRYLGLYPQFWGGGNLLPGGIGVGGARPPRQTEGARVVDGLGYTRVRPRVSEPRDTASGGGRSTRARSAAVSPQGYTNPQTSSGGSGSGGSTSGATSSSGGSGRTAVPR